MRIGVDIGGTFTDVVLQASDGEFFSWKVPSTPPEFWRGVISGLELAASELGTSVTALLRDTSEFLHGTTVTTNVLLARKGERVGLLTTRGFADTYALARQYRGSEQDPALVTHPTPLVPREDIEEIDERLDYRGEIIAPIDERQVKEAVARLVDRGIRSFAICFLWSFVNSRHELEVKRIILEMVPDAYVIVSCEACPVLGEYERTSTAALTAFTGPALRQYALELENVLRERGFGGSLLLMKSDGGLGSIEAVVRGAGQTIYSGPAAGVMAAMNLAEAIGEQNLITFDMGGTSTDVAIVHGGQVRSTSLQFIERQAVAAPTIDITTVGAGGGSVAWRAAGSTLRVGPQSAGAVPGPACYARGGDEATTTDANLVMGLLATDAFLGGRLTLDRAPAEHALAVIAGQLGLSQMDTAFGIFRVTNAVMADAIRLRTVFAGLDPRDFTLVSFGGAGGLHCAAVARELGISQVIIPRNASVFSAFGLVSTDVTYTAAKSDVREIASAQSVSDEQLAEINEIYADLERQVDASLDAHAIEPERRIVTRSIELAYRRQILNFEVATPRPLDRASLALVIRDFDAKYARIYGPGAAAPEHGYSLKTYRVTAVGRLARPPRKAEDAASPSAPEPRSRRPALADTSRAELSDLPVFAGESLRPGNRLAGPALIEFADTTVLAPSDSYVSVDSYSNLVLQLVRTPAGKMG